MKNIVNFCLCCSCCCAFLNIIKASDHPANEINSTFQAKIDADTCNACGDCRKRCQVKAVIADKANKAFMIDNKRCIGCGLCVSTCPENSISMVEKETAVEPPPDNIVDMNITIARERGILK